MAILVLSSLPASYQRHGRMPFDRMVIPSNRLSPYLHYPQGYVWWAERQGKKIMLRARARVKATIESNGDDDLSKTTTWLLSELMIERLSAPRSVLPEVADVSRVLTDRNSHINHIDISEIPDEFNTEFEKRRASLGSIVLSYDDACRHYKHLTRMLRLSEKVVSIAGDFSQAYIFARKYFARSEMASYNQWDVYDVAASALAGYSVIPIPMKYQQDEKQPKESHVPSMAMRPFDFDRESIAVENHESSSYWPNNLERKDKYHQTILAFLGKELFSRGLTPMYNCFVDLAVSLGFCDILFEVKTTNVDNLIHQARLAVGQLLEYRFRMRKQNGDKPIKLVAVVEKVDSTDEQNFVREFLDYMGISLIVWDRKGQVFEGLDPVLAGF